MFLYNYYLLVIMVPKKHLIDNTLIETVLEARIDALWKSLKEKAEGKLKSKDMEGVTGNLDNKGGLFVPGGFVYEDSDGEIPSLDHHFNTRSTTEFRDFIISSMKMDNATLIYHEGISKGINLDNGFYIKGAKAILNYKKGSNKRKKMLNKSTYTRKTSKDITRTYSPPYMLEYGSRTILSSCLGYFLQNPWGAYERFVDEYKLGENEQKALFESMSISQYPVKTGHGKVLAPPSIVVCHDSRIKERNMVGMTKIIPPGKPGTFSTITIEPAYKDLLAEFGRKKSSFSSNDIVATYNNDNYVIVMRSYTAPRNFGKRPPHKKTRLIQPGKELGMDLAAITQEARDRYGVN